MRSSTYRHVYGDPTRKDKCFDNIRLTKNAFDANLAKSNGKYISLNWEASGGGSFAVIPVAEEGKLPDRFPLFDGHKGPVLDTDWNPFDEDVVVSASDDGTIGVWRVPENFSVHEDYGALDDCKDIAPIKFLTGHGKKVGHVAFNPVAENILASASLDNTVKIWDVETGEVLFTLKHPSFVTSLSWNYDGTKLVTVAKDKQLRVWDVRNEKVLTSGKGHAGAKGSRVIWLGDNDRVLTTGFSLISDREMALWDSNDIEKGPIGGFRGLDPSSGIVIPHYDPMTSMVYLGGRGDGKIVYYEFADDNLYDLFAYNSTSPQRGLGWAPNRSLDPESHEVARVYKVHENMIEPIHFRVPLKTEGFLDNIYKLVEATTPALSAKEWKEGQTKRPLVQDWKELYEGNKAEAKEAPKTEAPKATETPKAAETKVAETTKPAETSKASETSKTAEPKKVAEPAEPKSVEETKASKEEVAALNKAEKQDSYDVLQSKEVKSFLEKNREEEDEEEAADEVEDSDSAWGVEVIDKASASESNANASSAATSSSSKSDSQKAASAKPAESPKKEEKPVEKPEEKPKEVKEPVETKKSTSDAPAATGSEQTTGSKLDEIMRRLEDLSTRIAKIEEKF